MKLKENLRVLLNSKDLTASALARSSNVPKQTIADWLAGAVPKDVRQVKRVADAFGVTVDGLCFEQLPAKSPKSVFSEHENEINTGVFEVILRRVTK